MDLNELFPVLAETVICKLGKNLMKIDSRMESAYSVYFTKENRETYRAVQNLHIWKKNKRGPKEILLIEANGEYLNKAFTSFLQK